MGNHIKIASVDTRLYHDLWSEIVNMFEKDGINYLDEAKPNIRIGVGPDGSSTLFYKDKPYCCWTAVKMDFGHPTTGRVFEVTIEDMLIIEDGQSKCQPIKLDEQWLIFFGFIDSSEEYPHIFKGKNGDTGRIFLKKGYNISLRLLNGIVHLVFILQPYSECESPSYLYDYKIESTEINFIHQLQNLFAVLIGEELEATKPFQAWDRMDDSEAAVKSFKRIKR